MGRLIGYFIIWSFTIVCTATVGALAHEALKGNVLMMVLAVSFLSLLIWFAVSSEKRQERSAAEARRALELWHSHSHNPPHQG